MGLTNGIPEYGIHDKLFMGEFAERFINKKTANDRTVFFDYGLKSCTLPGSNRRPAD